MELRVLRSFLAVARERSISGAARLVHTSQPNLSRQILDLEEELGVVLFHRGNRKVTLTEQGVLFRKRAEQILELVKKTEEEMTASDNAMTGTIRIGAGESHTFTPLAKCLHKLIQQYPSVKFNLYSGNAEDVMEKLSKGLLDFGLFIEPHDITKFEYLRLPTRDTWGVLMRNDSPLATKSAIMPKDLWEVPLICSIQALEGGQLSSWLQTDITKLTIVGTYNLLFNASLMVEAGAGYAMCLDGIINTHGSDLCFRPLAPSLTSYVDLAWKKNQVFSKPSLLLLETMRNSLSD